MLAHDYMKRGKSIVYPAFVQPKLDGIRVIAHRRDNDVVYYSRLGNKFATLNHLNAAIMAISPPGAYLDGEIYVHGVPFELICSAVKRDNPNTDSKKMQYWVFDIINDLPFSVRNELLETYASSNESIPDDRCDTPLVFLPAIEVNDEASMKKAHKVFTENGFEGTMIRNDAEYVQKRSVNLQKYKDFDNEEFEIIGAKQAQGKDIGMIIFTCITAKGIEFDVEPSGDDDTRREMWNKYYGNEGIFEGKKLTVKFQGYLQSGAPRFPTAGVIRDYE